MKALALGALTFNLVWLSACSTGAKHPVVDEQVREQRLKDEYQRQYAQYEVAAANVPAMQKLEIKKLPRRGKLAEHNKLQLELELGQRWAVASNSVFRTESRYRLLNADKRLLASAESTFAVDDLSTDAAPALEVYYDPGSYAYLIAEQQSWATFRYIVIQPTRDADATGEDALRAWSVIYLDIPTPESLFPPEGLPHILGLSNNHVYVQQGGRTYAFPIGALKRITDLAYAIG